MSILKIIDSNDKEHIINSNEIVEVCFHNEMICVKYSRYCEEYVSGDSTLNLRSTTVTDLGQYTLSYYKCCVMVPKNDKQAINKLSQLGWIKLD